MRDNGLVIKQRRKEPDYGYSARESIIGFDYDQEYNYDTADEWPEFNINDIKVNIDIELIGHDEYLDDLYNIIERVGGSFLLKEIRKEVKKDFGNVAKDYQTVDKGWYKYKDFAKIKDWFNSTDKLIKTDYDKFKKDGVKPE